MKRIVLEKEFSCLIIVALRKMRDDIKKRVMIYRNPVLLLVQAYVAICLQAVSGHNEGRKLLSLNLKDF